MTNNLVVVDHPENIAVIVNKLGSEYAGRFHAHSRVGQMFYVRTDDIPAIISQKLGMTARDRENDGETGVSGSVYCLTSSYYGFTDTGIWEWLLRDVA